MRTVNKKHTEPPRHAHYEEEWGTRPAEMGAKTVDTMATTIAENKEKAVNLPKQIVEEGNLDLVEEHFAEDYVGQNNAVPEPYDRDGFKDVVSMFRAAFPDLELASVEDVIAEADKVVRRDVWTGTHDGPLMDIDPTGTEVEIELINIIRFDDDGKVIEERFLLNMLGLLQQTGVVEPPGD